MTKEEALEDIENIRMYFADNTWNQHHFKALDIAKECIRHCIDEEENIMNTKKLYTEFIQDVNNMTDSEIKEAIQVAENNSINDYGYFSPEDEEAFNKYIREHYKNTGMNIFSTNCMINTTDLTTLIDGLNNAMIAYERIYAEQELGLEVPKEFEKIPAARMKERLIALKELYTQLLQYESN